MTTFSKIAALVILLACALSAQEIVQLADTPPVKDQHTKYGFVSGSNNYICFAKTPAAPVTVSVNTISNASTAVITLASHGFDLRSTPTVTFKGATGNWLPLNTGFVATPIDANSFSIPLNTSSFGAITGTITMTTQAPMLNQNIWLVQKTTVDASGQPAYLWSTNGYGNTCQNLSSLSFQ